MLTNFEENNLQTYRGDDLGIKLVFQDTDEVPIDITSWTIFLTIKKTKDRTDAAAVIKMDKTNIPNPELGIVWITVPNTLTKNLIGSYWYDIQIKKADDTIQTVTNGNINFLTDTTIRTIPV
jgi:hypothetical protein